MRDSDLLSSPAVPGKCRASDIMHLYPMEFTITNSMTMTLSRSPQYMAFTRAVMDENSLSSLFPVGVGSGYK